MSAGIQEQIIDALTAAERPLSPSEIHHRCDASDGVASLVEDLRALREQGSIVRHQIDGRIAWWVPDRAVAATQSGSPDKPKAAPQTVAPPLKQQVLNLLSSGPATGAEIRKALPGLSNDQLRNALYALKRAGQIARDGVRGSAYRLPSEGGKTKPAVRETERPDPETNDQADDSQSRDAAIDELADFASNALRRTRHGESPCKPTRATFALLDDAHLVIHDAAGRTAAIGAADFPRLRAILAAAEHLQEATA